MDESQLKAKIVEWLILRGEVSALEKAMDPKSKEMQDAKRTVANGLSQRHDFEYPDPANDKGASRTEGGYVRSGARGIKFNTLRILKGRSKRTLKALILQHCEIHIDREIL